LLISKKYSGGYTFGPQLKREGRRGKRRGAEETGGEELHRGCWGWTPLS